MGNGKERRIRALIDAIVAYLGEQRNISEAAEATLQRINAADLSARAFADLPASLSRHDPVLQRSIRNIEAASLQPLRHALAEAREDLVWREDDMTYYPPGSDLGAGYKNCNLHSLLIGPGACGFHHDDFLLGLFMLGPRTLYRDHQHEAPETYITLSAQSGWRLAERRWQDYPAGSIIFNPRYQVHATRVYQEPFLSVFSWLENIKGQCAVVPRDDWPALERRLADPAEGQND